MNKFQLFLFLFFVSYSQAFAQFAPPLNWYMMDYKQDGQRGIGADRSYADLLNDKTPAPVIVAVLDSGIDIEHEDLSDNIWVNLDEKPDNGIDDDKNGYIDDVNGWNFIGGEFEDVYYDRLEVTRLYAAMREKYEEADPTKLDKDDLKEYSEFTRYKEEVETKRAKALKKIDQYGMARQAYNITLNSVKAYLDTSFVNPEIIDTMSTASPDLELAKTILTDILYTAPEGISIDTILFYVNMDLDAALQKERITIDYHYNPEFDARKVIGDDYSDQREIGYGNNRVEGPDAMHGTHVAGLIAALRSNDIGINGIASNVQIMPLRVVPPEGDEHDKDVANAIRYAVDNGASIINMSFGKGKSWNKEIVDDAVAYAVKNDVLLIHSAGNAGENNDKEPNFPNDRYEKPRGFLFWKKKKAKTWLEVGALSFLPDDYMVATFSNYGAEEVDIFAPGVAIYSTLPDDTYGELQGTSFSSPIVAGVAAVLRSYYPTLKAEQVKSIILDSATKINQDVIVPGTDERKPFKSLSTSGGILNMYDAIVLASKTKGKKKIKKAKSKA